MLSLYSLILNHQFKEVLMDKCNRLSIRILLVDSHSLLCRLISFSQKFQIENFSNKKKPINQHKFQPLTMILFYDFDCYLFVLQLKMNLCNGPTQLPLLKFIIFTPEKNRGKLPN